MQTQKITACAFVHHAGKMLGVQRAAHKTFLPNKWELVGGHIEFGETLEEGLKREIREELNSKAVIDAPFFAFTYLKDQDTHSVEVIFLAELEDPNSIQLDPDALQAYKWLTKEEAIALYDNQDPEFPALLKGFDLIQT